MENRAPDEVELADKDTPLVDDEVRSRNREGSGQFGDDMRTAIQQLKRERIVAAAVDLFEEHGFSRTSLDLVAEQLGVTKPVIYAQFQTKSKLLGEICSRAMRISLEAIDEALRTASDPRARLEKFASGLMLGVLRSGKHLAIYMREEKHLAPAELKLIRDLRRQVDLKLIEVLKRGVAEGDFDVPDEKIAAMAIGGIATWIGMRLGPNGRFPPEEIAAKVVPLIMSMAGARVSHKGDGEPPAP